MISIIIPFFNEEDNIQHYNVNFFPKINEIAKNSGKEFNFIFINDGSEDKTLYELNKLADEHKNVKVLSYNINQGMGAAIKVGLKNCDSEFIITMDSDLTFRPEDIKTLIEGYNNTQADCVSGSPYLQKGLMDEVTPFRLLLSKSINFLFRLLLSQKISCVSPIFRLYKAECLKDLKIKSNNFEINAEIISKLIISKKSVIEVPVELHRREYGESKINIFKEMKNYIFLLYNIIRVKYLKKEWI